MGHVLLAAPTIERFHLHEQVGRRLLRRGHRVTLLATDPVTFRCYDVHGLPTRLLMPGREDGAGGFAIQEFAARDARLEGTFPPDLRRLRRLARRLARRTAPLLRLFETEIPDVVVTTDGRSGLHRLVAAVARTFGSPVVHFGEGLLPGTLQRDPEGIDGDASTCARSALFYRGARADRALCNAALAGILGDVAAPPVAQRFVHPPDWLDLVACVATARSRAALRAAFTGIAAWRAESRRVPPRPTQDPITLPEQPFVAVLLQGGEDARVRLDTADRCPSPLELATAVRRAIGAIDPALRVVAIPPRAADDTTWHALRSAGVEIAPPRHAAHAAMLAATVVTVNHPLGFAAVLAGTPVVHTGRTPYGVGGIAHATTLDELRPTLELALGTAPATTLRNRFATHLLAVDHIWCHAAAPDPNGLRGFVAHVEDVLQRATPAPEPTPYRPGPSWPLLRDA